MYRPPKLRIIFYAVVCAAFLCASPFAQKTRDADIDMAACWSYPLGDALAENISVDDGNVFLAFAGAKVHALSRTGKKIWSSEFGGEITSNILVRQERLFFVTSTSSDIADKAIDSKLRWVSKETGITSWTQPLPVAERHFLSFYEGNIIAVSNSGIIQSINIKNGNINWTRQVAERFVAEPSFSATNVSVAATGERIFGILLATGEIQSIKKAAVVITAIDTSKNGKLIVGDERGSIYPLNGDNKPGWSFKTGGAISAIFSVDDNILLASQDNFIYFLSAASGGRVWKKRSSGRIAHITNIDGKYVLVSAAFENSAVLVDLLTGRVAGQIVFGENETVAAQPVGLGMYVFVLTNSAVYSYSITGNSGCLKI